MKYFMFQIQNSLKDL